MSVPHTQKPSLQQLEDYLINWKDKCMRDALKIKYREKSGCKQMVKYFVFMWISLRWNELFLLKMLMLCSTVCMCEHGYMHLGVSSVLPVWILGIDSGLPGKCFSLLSPLAGPLFLNWATHSLQWLKPFSGILKNKWVIQLNLTHEIQINQWVILFYFFKIRTKFNLY